MSALLGMLQGSYAYLLIFQIVVVTILLLCLLWLIARRLREQRETESAVDPAQIQANEELTALTAEQTERIKALEAQISELEKGGAGIGQLKEKNKALVDKVGYLEQKLLEYEILQEEISALSALKVENERLRQQLVEQGLTPEAAPAPAAQETPAAPAAPVESSTPPPALELEGAEPLMTPPPSVLLDAGKEPEAPTDLKPFDDDSNKAQEPAPPSLEQGEIDGLLAQIDTLSSSRKQP